MSYHNPVLLQESVDGMEIKGDEVVVDVTFGGGGHSKEILSRLGKKGKLFGFDQDEDAVQNSIDDARFVLVKQNFRYLKNYLKLYKVIPVDAVLADLGVSSHQFDEGSRGFSIRFEGPLDMRMNPDAGVSAAQWIASAHEAEIADVLYKYGDEHFSRRIAKAIVMARQEHPIETTLQLAEIIKTAHPKWDHKKHPATKSFQAIRIFINGELNELDEVLLGSLPVLKSGGRLAIISFHSLEDRAVKQFIRLQAQGPEMPPGLPIQDADIERNMKAIGKAIKPTKLEIAANVRSRSATLRVAEKL